MASGKNPSYNNMVKDMAGEMDKRQREWQKEVEKMQQDFFKTVKIDQPPADHNRFSANVLKPSSPAPNPMLATLDDMEDGIQRFADGTAVFRARFDVRDFDHDDVSIRVEDLDEEGRGHRLVVSARHVETGYPGQQCVDVTQRRSLTSNNDTNSRSRSREFNRRLNLPANVDVDRLTSRLAYDGLLTIEAPLLPVINSYRPVQRREAPPGYETLATTRQGSQDGRQLDRIWSTSSADRNTSFPDVVIAAAGGARGYEIIDMDGYRLLKMVLDLGTIDFSPEDVRVIVDADRKTKLSIVARRETTSPLTGKATKRQFTRDLEVTEMIDRSTVGAALDTSTGRLLIIAVVVQGSTWSSGALQETTSGLAAVQRLLKSACRSPTTHQCTVELR